MELSPSYYRQLGMAVDVQCDNRHTPSDGA